MRLLSNFIMKKIINLFVMAALLMAGSRSFAQNNHEYVDLGLPSGTLWATCNVGANSPEEYGDYFAWGETQPKTIYSRGTYKYSKGLKLTKYCYKSKDGYNGFTDNLTTLEPSDDAATANWGSDWCAPTKEQWEELRKNTTNKWTTRKGVKGLLFIASNGNSLFLPAAGYRWDNETGYVGGSGHYWSGSLPTSNTLVAWGFIISSDGCDRSIDHGRSDGLSVRAVRSLVQSTIDPDTKSYTTSHEYVDLGLPSGTLWATCNVGASTPEGNGDYFAWGETQPKTIYSSSTYKYSKGLKLTKYCYKSKDGYNGFTDNLTTLEASDDAATANWGSDWCTPTKEQWEELRQNTTNKWTTQNGVKGMLFIARNGNSLFLPAAGGRSDDDFRKVGICGYYLSSSLHTDGPDCAWIFHFDSTGWSGEVSIYRNLGQSVRPVRSSGQK